jgi:DNA relaxase NicK
MADNVSRIDVQVTIQETNPCINHAIRGLDAAKQDRRVKAGMTITSLISSTPAGTTAYIGARVSQRFYRIYDKSAESKGIYPPGCWRFEVEYKGPRAEMVGKELARLQGTPDASRQIVEQAFYDYGVVIPCRALSSSWRDTSPRTETTDERRLRWLEKSIAPVIGRMMESMDRRTVLQALGIIVDGEDGVIDTPTGEMLPG